MDLWVESNVGYGSKFFRVPVELVDLWVESNVWEVKERVTPLTKLQSQVLAVIADAKNGISGLSIATWLLRRRNPDGIKTVLRSLENRGLITMQPMDDPADEFRKQFPDRMKAIFSIKR